jgi:Asp-tRNA(Asn)/Glu-tRNA(Gln) amidotransferase A subunit family amidase
MTTIKEADARTAAERDALPALRPFLSARRRFMDGSDSPRDLLERCLAALDRWETRIDAFVNLNIDGARAAADASTRRWVEGKPRSAIDGMPLGIKDIIETIDMPTENGSPLYAGWRSDRDAAGVAALREAGAVILGKTVTTEFAAREPRGTRNPWDTTRTPGGSSSGSAAAVVTGMVSAALGTQVIGSTIRPASFCGCVGFKPTVGALNRGGSHDALSQSCTGLFAANLEDAWQVAHEIAVRAGGDPGYPGLFGPNKAPAARKPQHRRLAFLETAGWTVAEAEAKACIERAVAQLKAHDIEVIARESEPKLEAVERALADATSLSNRINDWEGRWPLNTYRARDAEKLSALSLERLARAEAMTLDDYRALLAERGKIRQTYAALHEVVDACITLSAPGPAPVGLGWTGDASFAVPASLLGTPAISLPLFSVGGLPLGFQVIGFEHGDAPAFATAAWIEGALRR